MGRRWGKTIVGGTLGMNVFRQGGRAAWIVPQYRNGRALWRFVVEACVPLVQAGIVQISNSERVATSIYGGFFGIYSADNIDSVRNEAFNLVVGDEAARIDGDGWQAAVRPTLADADGDEILISTPVGKNWFYDEWMRGAQHRDGYASWTAPSSANPNPNIQRAYHLARERLPERVFLQEWQAQFVEDGAIFRNVYSLSCLKPEPPHEGHTYVIGVDWGRTEDATVFCVFDATARRQVYLDILHDVDFAAQRERLVSLAQRYNNAHCVVETNSIGAPQFEELKRSGRVSVSGFETNNARKAALIDDLQLALESESIQLLDDERQKSELVAFSSVRLPSGLVRYAAPAGKHDDAVMALALALYACNTPKAEELFAFV
ncbi:MAG: hypothetical protein ACOY4M_08400 [Pseudomonadota bacterium]